MEDETLKGLNSYGAAIAIYTGRSQECNIFLEAVINKCFLFLIPYKKCPFYS
jgi:hypothetical protein